VIQLVDKNSVVFAHVEQISLPRQSGASHFSSLSRPGLHDVGEAFPPPSPASEALAVQLKGLEPGLGQARILGLKKQNLEAQNANV